MDKSEVEAMIMKKRELEFELNTIKSELVSVIENFDGTVKDALSIGLVKPAFALPDGYRRHLNQLNQR